MQNFMVVSLWVEELFKFLSQKLCKKLILPPPLLSFLGITLDELAALTVYQISRLQVIGKSGFMLFICCKMLQKCHFHA